jgi:hypothetical protein
MGKRDDKAVSARKEMREARRKDEGGRRKEAKAGLLPAGLGIVPRFNCIFGRLKRVGAERVAVY